MNVQDAVKGAIVGAAVVGSTAATSLNATIASSQAPNAVKESATVLVEHMAEAGEEGAKGIREGEEAAEAEPVAEPLYSDEREAEDVTDLLDLFDLDDPGESTSDLENVAHLEGVVDLDSDLGALDAGDLDPGTGGDVGGDVGGGVGYV